MSYKQRVPVGGEVVIDGVLVRTVRFRDFSLATCDHCPGRDHAKSICRVKDVECGERLCDRFVPVDMIPVLFLRGELE